jgi:hypothetical protein
MANSVYAAQSAIDAHHFAYHLEDGHPPSTALYHLLLSLLDWCDYRGVDFDATLSEVRADVPDIRGEGGGPCST